MLFQPDPKLPLHHVVDKPMQNNTALRWLVTQGVFASIV